MQWFRRRGAGVRARDPPDGDSVGGGAGRAGAPVVDEAGGLEAALRLPRRASASSAALVGGARDPRGAARAGARAARACRGRSATAGSGRCRRQRPLPLRPDRAHGVPRALPARRARAVGPGAAAAVLAAAPGRRGRHADRRRPALGRARQPVRPLRWVGLASGAGLAARGGARPTAPLAVLVPVLVVAGAISMAWNGLSVTAAAELAGRAQERRGDRVPADDARDDRRPPSPLSSP